jgi:hypothetical protein
MIVSDNRAVGQVGTTIGLGLLFDTLIVRSFMTPSIAALLVTLVLVAGNVWHIYSLAPRAHDQAGTEDTAEIAVPAATTRVRNGKGALTANGSMPERLYHRIDWRRAAFSGSAERQVEDLLLLDSMHLRRARRRRRHGTTRNTLDASEFGGEQLG